MDPLGKLLPLKFARFLSYLIRRLIIDHNFCKELKDLISSLGQKVKCGLNDCDVNS